MHILLFPFSLLYTAITNLRNWLYDKQYFKSARFQIPIISVGNLSVGGTGKSPHIEYLVSLFQSSYQVGILSRGFGREGREYEVASPQSTALEIGDEPLMFKLKHPATAVAVGIDRIHCIPRMVGDFPDLDMILLDDAYQHRAVRPGLSILLTDYNDPFYTDSVLPVGRLRERRKNYHRADVLIVTKCPATLDEKEKESIRQKMKPKAHQHLYFSSIAYGQLYGLFPELHTISTALENAPDGGYVLRQQNTATPPNCLLVSGIANPAPLEAYLKSTFEKVFPQHYPDHHTYDTHDMEVIKSAYFDIGREQTFLVTTEKDAVRFLAYKAWFLENKIQLYVQSMRVKFLGNDQHLFEKDMLDYIQFELARYKPTAEEENIQSL